jgi:hypothetical protein
MWTLASSLGKTGVKPGAIPGIPVNSEFSMGKMWDPDEEPSPDGSCHGSTSLFRQIPLGKLPAWTRTKQRSINFACGKKVLYVTAPGKSNKADLRITAQ